MSRRAPDPAADRAARNTQTLKNLVKLESNKSCADCKRNKHPRWASWNLGIFVCIRCSGIHRGMGTHISRVKSVDLDSWTDEQLQSMLKWGNTRANKYWEAKLAPGHVPSEAKIENFIRTKYESKRWVMEGPIPDPSTLDGDGDDDVPLSIVKEKVEIERSASQRASSASQVPTGPSGIRRAPQPDLFGDDPAPRATSATSATARPPPPRAEAAPPKPKATDSSLLGLDFFGTPAPAPNRPASAAPSIGTSGPSRPDLKQSILSLYASAPKPQPSQQPQHSQQNSFGGMQSPPISQPSQNSFGGLNDSFGGLSFSSPASPPVPAAQPSPFAGLGNITTSKSPPPTNQPNYGGGGSFFDPKPTPKAAPAPPQASRAFSSSSGFGAFDSAPGISPAATQPSSNSGLGDLFDFAAPPSSSIAPAAPKQTISSPPPQSSVFNLSQPQQQAPAPQATSTGWGNSDAWGSNDAWATPDAGSKITSPVTQAPPKQANSNDFGWGSGSGSLASQSIIPGTGGGFAAASSQPAKPTVAADDDFGGWSSAAPVTPGAGATKANGKPATGFGGSDDLFSNVWE